jgi:hypothetical protein
MGNAVELSPFDDPFAVASFGFSREFSTRTRTIGFPGDLRQTTVKKFLALFRGFGQQEFIQIPGHGVQGGFGFHFFPGYVVFLGRLQHHDPGQNIVKLGR